MSTILKALRRLEEDKPAGDPGANNDARDRRGADFDESIPATDPRAANALRDRILAEEYAAEAGREMETRSVERRRMVFGVLAGVFAFAVGVGLYVLVGDWLLRSEAAPVPAERTLAEGLSRPAATPPAVTPASPVRSASAAPANSPTNAATAAPTTSPANVAAARATVPTPNVAAARPTAQTASGTAASPRAPTMNMNVAAGTSPPSADSTPNAPSRDLEEEESGDPDLEFAAVSPTRASREASVRDARPTPAADPARSPSASTDTGTPSSGEGRETERSRKVSSPSREAASTAARRPVREESADDDAAIEAESTRAPSPEKSSAAPRKGDLRPNSKPTPVEAAERVEVPDLSVVRTAWHPKPDRRSVRIRLEETGDVVTLREGDAVGGLVIQEISPSAVLFKAGEVEIRRRIGQGG